MIEAFPDTAGTRERRLVGMAVLGSGQWRLDLLDHRFDSFHSQQGYMDSPRRRRRVRIAYCLIFRVLC